MVCIEVSKALAPKHQAAAAVEAAAVEAAAVEAAKVVGPRAAAVDVDTHTETQKLDVMLDKVHLEKD
jgi:hypothetical protein